MKKIWNRARLLLLAGLLQTCLYDDYIGTYLSIAEFPDAKRAAIAFTFDDNCPSSFSSIVPMFQHYNYKATFFIIAGQIISEAEWNNWRALSEIGFDIRNHSYNHLNLAQLNDTATLQMEINGAYELIKDRIGKAPFSFAHPRNKTNQIVNQIMSQKHYASRIYPLQFCRAWGVVSESEERHFEDLLDDAIRNKSLLVIAAWSG